MALTRVPHRDGHAGGATRKVQVLPFDLARAHELYKALLGPAEDLIKGKHLLIVPSGPLTSLPFNVLVTEPPKAAMPARSPAIATPPGSARASRSPCCPRWPRSRRCASSPRPSRATKPYLGIGNPLLDGPQERPQVGRALQGEARPPPATGSNARRPAAADGLARRGAARARAFSALFRGAQADIEHVRIFAAARDRR